MRAWAPIAISLIVGCERAHSHNQLARQTVWVAAPMIMEKTSAHAAKRPITSIYTKLQPCRPVVEAHEAYWVDQCRGFAGVPLFLQNGDERYDISAGMNDGVEDFDGGFNFPGDTIEWRLSNGKPFAIIFRIIVDPAMQGRTDFPKSSRLMVETVGKHPCRIAEIPGDTPNANAAARAAADEVLDRKAKCIDFEERRRQGAESR